MTRTRSLLLATLLAFAPLAAHAEAPKPDDSVVFDITAEDWVTTKSARVTVGVEAAVSGNNAGTMRGAMLKAVGEVAKAEWRIVSFNRSQDQTGMERWSAQMEARLPEAELNGLYETAKKVSKPGMQIAVHDVDFSPTLEETQTAAGLLRTKLYKNANDQLAALNATLTGRAYRIALIDFTNNGMPSFAAKPMYARAKNMMAEMDSVAAGAPAMERSEKIILTARVVLSTLPPTASK